MQLFHIERRGGRLVIYIINYALLHIYLLVRKIPKKYLALLVLFQVLIILFLKRDDVGIDLPIYTQVYKNIASLSSIKNNGYEPGFLAFFSLCNYFKINIHIVFCMIYIFVNFSFYYFFKKYSVNPILSWIILIAM